MGSLRTLAFVILGFSGFIFIALFGRIPAFRKTPIGFLHRTIWIYIPNGIAYVDNRLLGGRFLQCWNRFGSYILHENHPLVLIFFVLLLIAGEFMFIPSAWPRISTGHRLCVPVVAILPYVLLYASVVSRSDITPENHSEEIERYPYDRVIFHPGHYCRTCRFLKPARSKHCNVCKACVARQDHHCIWLTNCVGRNNYHYFLSMLLSMSVLLIYATLLGYSLLSQTLENLVPSSSSLRSTKQSWSVFINIWSVVIASDVRIGAVALLACLTSPLAVAFLVYHSYLIWAGMTTNESAKWSEWKEDVADGLVFKSSRSKICTEPPTPDHKHQGSWPISSDQILVFTDGQPPTEGYLLSSDSSEIIRNGEPGTPVDPRWVRVRNMGEVDNIYDLGFWDNLRDSFRLPIRRRPLHP